jgi:magnesium transporter
VDGKQIQEFLSQVNVFLEDIELKEDASFSSELHSSFFSFHTSDQAEIISSLKGEKRDKFIEAVLADIDAEVLLHFEKAVLHDFVDFVGNEVFGKMLSVLDINMAVSVISDFPKDFKKEILEFVQYKKRIKIKRLLAYPTDSVGRNMSMDFLSIPAYFTVKDTMNYLHKTIKKYDREAKNLEIFVISEDGKIAGTVSIFDLIRLKGADLIKENMRPIVHILNTYDSTAEAIEIFIEYHLQVIPVVDSNQHIAGVLEINNVTNLIRDEAEKNLLMPAGVFETTKEGIFGLAKSRFTWLFINLITASLASSVISGFEHLVASFAVLAVFTPIVASIGGNTGNQTSAVMIRSLAINEFEPKLILREILATLINAICFSFICFIISYAIYRNLMLSLSFGLAIFITLNVAGFIGSCVPVLISKLKIDPALGSSIFLTMVTDMTGFFSFLGIAYLLL